MEGLEPPHLAASDPKSDVSTNFTTCAFGAAKVIYFLIKKELMNQEKIKLNIDFCDVTVYLPGGNFIRKFFV
jgi:hypothetical protein